MAYRSNSRSARRPSRGRVSTRRSTRRAPRRARRSTGVRRTGRTGTQTVRLVIEQAPASAIARPDIGKEQRPSRKAMF